MRRNLAPGGALVHPAFLLALCVLVLNDHVLKRVCPGVVTGKLSDFAGVLLLPIFLHALLELGSARVLHKPLDSRSGDRMLVGCVVVSLLAFALPEVWKPAELAYRYGLGAARWPFQVLFELSSGQAPLGVRPVRATADVTDLLALPMGLLAFRIGRRAARPVSLGRTDHDRREQELATRPTGEAGARCGAAHPCRATQLKTCSAKTYENLDGAVTENASRTI